MRRIPAAEYLAMMVIPYKPHHLDLLNLQQAQALMGDFIQAPGYAEMLGKGPAYTGIIGTKVIIVAGVLEDIPGRGLAWALLSKDACNHLLACSRAVKNFLETCQMRRVQTYVETSFAAGHRWARMLGFEREGTLKAWGPSGEDYDIYARLK